jgi:hypothetical protein
LDKLNFNIQNGGNGHTTNAKQWIYSSNTGFYALTLCSISFAQNAVKTMLPSFDIIMHDMLSRRIFVTECAGSSFSELKPEERSGTYFS